MAYTGQQRFLLRDAQKYADLGYRVGLCKGKKFIAEYQPDEVSAGWFGMPVKTQKEQPTDFDGISIIPEEIACVDIDIPDFGVVYEELPITWKERTPRGWHLWYRLPLVIGSPWSPQIKWRPHVDLLVKATRKVIATKKRAIYGSSVDDDDEDEPDATSVWGEHVLCSGTTGYQLVWPEAVPAKDKLTLAPQWLQDALLK